MKKAMFVVLVVLLLALFPMPGKALANSNDVRTYILSNEVGLKSQGGLIDGLVASGHGNESLYQILQLLANQPGSNIPVDFVSSVANNHPDSEVFTVALSNFGGLNNPVGINADGSVFPLSINGRDYDGHSGFMTSGTLVTGCIKYTLASNSSYFIDTGQAVLTVPGNYQAIGIAWVKAARSFVISNESPGYFIDKLIAAGHGSENLYQVLQFLAAQPGSGIPADFVAEVGSSPSGSTVFTAPFHNFSGINNPICINADGTFLINPFFGRDYDGKSGFTTNNVQYSGIGPAKVTMATSPIYYIDAGGGSGSCCSPVRIFVEAYQAIGIAWANAVLTFVLSNESPGYLIDELIAAGYGNGNLYEALVALEPASGGVISDAFLDTLASNPAGSDIFTAPLSNFAGINNPVCINADGTVRINDIFGRDYHGQTGYATYPPGQTGVGRELFTYATSPQYYIDAGSSGTTYYKAFAIAWSGANQIGLSGPGWNLISLPLQPSDTAISTVLGGISGKYASAWAFQNGTWKAFDPASPGFSDLSSLETGWGYWLNMTQSATLSVAGTEPSKTINLISGWNLVGNNSSIAQNISNALSSIPGKVISVWAYKNNSWQLYDPASPGFSDLTTMSPGYGYWINTNGACTWTLP